MTVTAQLEAARFVVLEIQALYPRFPKYQCDDVRLARDLCLCNRHGTVLAAPVVPRGADGIWLHTFRPGSTVSTSTSTVLPSALGEHIAVARADRFHLGPGGPDDLS